MKRRHVIALAALALAGCSDGDHAGEEADAPTGPSIESTATTDTRDAKVTILLVDPLPLDAGIAADDPDVTGSPCGPRPILDPKPPYSRLLPGTPLVVRDAEGTIVGRVDLEQGTAIAGEPAMLECIWTTDPVPLVHGEVYEVEIDGDSIGVEEFTGDRLVVSLPVQ